MADTPWTIADQQPGHFNLLCSAQDVNPDTVADNLVFDPGNEGQRLTFYDVGLPATMLTLINDKSQTFILCLTHLPEFDAPSLDTITKVIRGDIAPSDAPTVSCTYSKYLIAGLALSGSKLTMTQYESVEDAINLIPEELRLLKFEEFIDECMLVKSQMNPDMASPILAAEVPATYPGISAAFHFNVK